MSIVKVSIIVPVYKVPEEYLRKCIESLTAQTLKDIEIILVDDGSPDNCGKICDEYASKDERIKVIHKENGGLSAARNTGFENAEGEYITFVDGDDWIDAEMCKVMYDKATEENVDLVICGISKDYGKERIPYEYLLQEGKVYRDADCKQLQVQLLMYNANMGAAYAKLIKRSVLSTYNILHDPVLSQGAEALEFNIRFFEHLKSAAFVKKHFYHYIYNDNSISSSHNEKNHELVVKCFEKIFKLIQKSDNKDQLIHWFYNRLLYVIITTAISGYFHPNNDESFNIKKTKYMKYLKQPIIANALKYKNRAGLSLQRKIVLFLIEHRMFRAIDILGKLRKWQKDHK